MRKLILKSLLAGLFFVCTGITQAQNQMLVETTTSGTEVYLVSEIRSIKFGPSSMNINRFNGTTATYNIAEIVQYYFADVTSTENKTIILDGNLSINPNPASEQIEIVYTSQDEDLISIDLLDVTGRSIAKIYNGKHQGKQAYKQNLDVSAVLYFCRIIEDGKIITKPLVVN
jgi:hypothetical protein